MNTIGTIYARFSSDNQREESIDGQLRDCIAWAARNNITLIDPYIDRALSAKTDNRPSFQKMIADSAKGLFDVIIVWKLDRFARNRYDSAHYKRILSKNGVRVVSATENISTSPDGILMESVLEGMAEYYSAELSEKVRRGMTDNMLKTRSNGGTRPFGLLVDKDGRFYPDPLLIPIIHECFQLYDDGYLIRDIAQYLITKGIVTQKGNVPNINFVTRMLRNRKYAGDYTYDGNVEEGAFPAIVPRDLFDRVQERMKLNKKASARYKAPEHYVLTTKLFCGECGALMAGESGTSCNGAIYNYYKCSSAKKRKGCKKKAVKKEFIEQVVVMHAKRSVMDDTTIACLAEMVVALQDKIDDKVPYFKQQLRDVEKSIKNILNAIEQGIFTTSTKERLDELEQRKSDIEVSIIQAEIETSRLTTEDVEKWLKQFRGLNTNDEEQCQLLIDSFVNAVYVYDDRIVIGLNARDGTHTITMEEAQSLFFSFADSSNIKPLASPERNPVGTRPAGLFVLFLVRPIPALTFSSFLIYDA